MVNLDRCSGSCNTLDDLSNRISDPNKIKDVLENLSVFDMSTRIKESKALTNHISCDCKCKFDGRLCNSNGIIINANVSAKTQENMCVKNNPST